MRKPLAVVCADLHLSEKPPIARSVEKDWFGVMAGQLSQLDHLAKSLGVPVLCAGDVFHKWNASNALVNFALDHLPEMYAVPGQHDLPFHRFEDLEDCAFGTLVKVKKVRLLTPHPTLIKGAWVYGFPWGFDIESASSTDDDKLRVAVVHAFIWREGKGFPGAPPEKLVGGYAEKLAGFDVALFGDNHKPFTALAGTCSVWNNGGFLRRNSDERKHKPRVGVLYSDGAVELRLLDCTTDQFLAEEEALVQEEASHTMQAFLKELGELGTNPLSFPDALKQYFTTYEVSKGARRLILESISNGS